MKPLWRGSTVASRTIMLLQDDIDGSNATQTVRFAIDGIEYEIDLSRMWARPRCLGSRHHPTVLKDLLDVLTRYPGAGATSPRWTRCHGHGARFRDLGHGELRSLVGLHAPSARFEQRRGEAVLVAQ